MANLRNIPEKSQDWLDILNSNFTVINAYLSAVVAESCVARRYGLRLIQNGNNAIYVHTGAIGISTSMYYNKSRVSFNVSSTDGTYYLYAAAHPDAFDLEASDFSAVIAPGGAPTYDATTGDYYYTGKRLIGFCVVASNVITKIYYPRPFRLADNLIDGNLLTWSTDSGDGHVEALSTITLAKGGTGQSLTTPAGHRLLGYNTLTGKTAFVSWDDNVGYDSGSNVFYVPYRRDEVTVDVTQTPYIKIENLNKLHKINATTSFELILPQLSVGSDGYRFSLLKQNTGDIFIKAPTGIKIGWQSSSAGKVFNVSSNETAASITLEYVDSSVISTSVGTWVTVEAYGSWEYK